MVYHDNHGKSYITLVDYNVFMRTYFIIPLLDGILFSHSVYFSAQNDNVQDKVSI